MAADPSDLLPRLFDVVPTAVVVAAADGRILRVNAAAREMLDLRDGETALRLVDIHHHPDDVRQQRLRLAARAADAQPLADVIDLTLRARSGEVVPVRARVAIVRSGEGKVVGTVHSYEDRREYASLTARLAEAVAQVEALERRVSGQAVLGRAAHELSQPLTAALGQIDMLLIEGSVPEAGAERLERAAEQLERMRNLVHELTRSANAHRPVGRG